MTVLDRPGGRTAVGLIVPALLLLLWWALTAAGVFSGVQLPPPAWVAEAAVDLLAFERARLPAPRIAGPPQGVESLTARRPGRTSGCGAMERDHRGH